jgi:hypothetical protein
MSLVEMVLSFLAMLKVNSDRDSRAAGSHEDIMLSVR